MTQVDLDRMRKYAFRRLHNWTLADDAVSYATEYALRRPDKAMFAASYGVYRVMQRIAREARRGELVRANVTPRVSQRMTAVEHSIADLPATLQETARVLATGASMSDTADLLGVSREMIRLRCIKLQSHLA